MTQSENQNLAQGTTVPLSEVNQPAPEESMVDKGLKNMAGFFAKMTGQPDPQTGEPQHNAQPQQTDQVSAFPTSDSPKSGFFQGLFAKTQQIFQKTSDFATSITAKTQTFADQVVEKTTAVKDTIVNAPTTVANSANSLIDKGMDMGSQLKGNIESTASNLTKDPISTLQNVGSQTLQAGQNLGNQAVQATSQAVEKVGSETGNFVKDPLQATQNLGNQAVQASSQAVNTVSSGAENFISDPIQASTQLGNQVLEQKNPNQNPTSSPSEVEGVSEKPGLFGSLGQGIHNVFEKTKEIGSQAMDKTTDFVKNPIENIDAITGNGVASTQAVPTETENTTSLDNLTSPQEEKPQ